MSRAVGSRAPFLDDKMGPVQMQMADMRCHGIRRAVELQKAGGRMGAWRCWPRPNSRITEAPFRSQAKLDGVRLFVGHLH
eukprot:325455-Pyramimonas_sp.AAC.1